MSRRRRHNDEPVEWNFFSFPVAFALVLGLFLGVAFSYPPFGALVFVVSLFFTSFGVAHIINRWFRRRGLDRQKLRDEEGERERRTLAARAASAQRVAEEAPPRPRRRRRVRRGGGSGSTS